MPAAPARSKLGQFRPFAPFRPSDELGSSSARRRRASPVVDCLVALSLVGALAGVGCGSGQAMLPGTGGSSAGSGGKTGSGGVSSSGGSQGSGGTSSSGGNSASGGATASGGTTGSGGTKGSGGSSASGGATASGGASSSGGATASGGASGSGGAGASGGVQGSGGVATGGSGSGGAGNGGASGTGGAGGAKVTPFLTEDFENGTSGKQPTGWDNFLSYQANITNPQSDGTMAVVDTMHAHSGKNAVHIHGGQNPAMLTRPLPTGTNKLYMRAFFFMTRQLGMGPQSANHETLLGIRKAKGTANDEVRFGEIKGVIGTNEVPSDNIAPKMAEWYKGPVVKANTWACIEVAFLADQPQHALYAWADGTLVHSITAPDQWQNGSMPMNWMDGKFVEFILGWQSFSGATNDVWVDDLVLSTGPIGCN